MNFLKFVMGGFGNILRFLLRTGVRPKGLGVIRLSPALRTAEDGCAQMRNNGTPACLRCFGKRGSILVLMSRLRSRRKTHFLRGEGEGVVMRMNGSRRLRMGRKCV